MPLRRMLTSILFLSACTVRADGDAPVDIVDRGISTNDGGPITTCGADGICNVEFCDLDEDPDCDVPDCGPGGGCNCPNDPDCEPNEPVCDREVAWATDDDSSSCDESFVVRRDPDDVLVDARNFILAKWPNWAEAKDLDYDDDNDGNDENNEDCWRNGHEHANLEGIGASLTRGTCGDPFWDDIHGVEGDFLQPSILMFEKNGNFASDAARTDWQVIGAGYHFHFDPCERPCMPTVPEWRWLIHEAGWHRTGDGGFDCVEQRDVKNDVDLEITDQCVEVEKDDFSRVGKTAAAKHERLWTLHIWFEPGGPGVAVSRRDPWCRWMDDGDEQIVEVDCAETAAFYIQSEECDC